MGWQRAMQLGAGLAEHAVAAIGRLAGRRYFDDTYFDRVYRSPDPWDYATSPYERARRAAVLAALPQRRYRSVLEVGCGEGHMTRLLAGRADAVVGLEISGSALARVPSLPENVRLIEADLVGPVPRQMAAAAFDLVVCAEVLYYCYQLPIGRASRVVRDRLVAWLAPGGELVLQHPHHSLLHRPFDRLCDEGVLVRVERRSVALPPRPVSIAVYRRPVRGADRSA